VVDNDARRLARLGKLTAWVRTASTDEVRRLRAEATETVWPLVYQRVTRPAERNRGHLRCASAMRLLAPECLDRFHDDVEAVVDDLFAHGDLPIENLEGWLTMRMPMAIVEGYRKRRGRRGAPQRPRVPVWLGTALGDDEWLVELAKLIMDWSGTDATAGASIWPLTRWTDLRLRRTGDATAEEATVAAEIETVLDVMRSRARWYENNVQGPLDRKPAPLWYAGSAHTARTEPEPLELVSPHERSDALLRELASWAIDVMARRIGGAERLEDLVTEVLGAVFGAAPLAYDLDQPPGTTPGGADEVVALIQDPERLDRIVRAVVEIIRDQAPV
jgi:hypothetical protein